MKNLRRSNITEKGKLNSNEAKITAQFERSSDFSNLGIGLKASNVIVL